MRNFWLISKILLKVDKVIAHLFFLKGFTFDTITPTNEIDFIETASNGNFIQNEDVPLTVDVEPNFKQIGTTIAIVFQIFTVVIKIFNILLILD